MSELLESIRKILNETRQDRVCRPLVQKQEELIPFLGSVEPVYFFLGLNPAGLELANVPPSAEEFIEYARRFFSTEQPEFSSYLPYTANRLGDYATFGQVATAGFLVPIPTRRSSEIAYPMAVSCWPRALTLVEATRPKLLLCHGSAVWKLLAGLETGEEPRLDGLPDTHLLPLKELYARVPAERLPFQARLGEGTKVWVLPLPHLGGAVPSKAVREKAEAAADLARRSMHGKPAGGRIRVRRVT